MKKQSIRKKHLTFKDLTLLENVTVIIPMVIIFYIGFILFGLIGAAIGGAIAGIVGSLIINQLSKRRNN